MKFLLVLQWATDEHFDFDSLIEKEEALISAVGELGKVDGHDMGSDEANIFIFTNGPEELFEALRHSILKDDLDELRVAFRKRGGEEYTTLWPPGLKKFRVA